MDNLFLLTPYERTIISHLFLAVDTAFKKSKNNHTAAFAKRTSLRTASPTDLDEMEQALLVTMQDLMTTTKEKQAAKGYDTTERLLPPSEKGLQYPKQINKRFWDLLKTYSFSIDLEIDKEQMQQVKLADGELPVVQSYWAYKIHKPQPNEQAVYENDDVSGIRITDTNTAKVISSLLDNVDPISKRPMANNMYQGLIIRVRAESSPAILEQVRGNLGLDLPYIDSFDMVLLTQLALLTQLFAVRWEAKKAPITDATITNVIVTGDKASKTIFSAKGDLENLPVAVNSSKTKPINIAVSLSFNNTDLSISKELNDYEKAVFSGIISIYKAQEINGFDNHYCTSKQIYEAMTGDYKDAVKDDTLAAVEASIDKMRTTLVYVDATEQMQVWNKGNISQKIIDKYKKENGKVIYDGNLLSLSSYIGPDRNGNRVRIYRFIEKPVLLSYAEDLGQVIDFPVSWLAIKTGELDKHGKPKLLSATTYNTLFTRLLCERLKVLQNKIERKAADDNDYIVLYKHFYDIMEANKGTQLTKVEKMRARETVTKILESWKQDGIIKDYTEHYRKETKGNVHILESIELIP